MRINKLAMVRAFIQGAKWWEYQKEGATMWQSDQNEAGKEAVRRLKNESLGQKIESYIDKRKKENP